MPCVKPLPAPAALTQVEEETITDRWWLSLPTHPGEMLTTPAIYIYPPPGQDGAYSLIKGINNASGTASSVERGASFDENVVATSSPESNKPPGTVQSSGSTAVLVATRYSGM
jgi:hypothetical protein